MADDDDVPTHGRPERPVRPGEIGVTPAYILKAKVDARVHPDVEIGDGWDASGFELAEDVRARAEPDRLKLYDILTDFLEGMRDLLRASRTGRLDHWSDADFRDQRARLQGSIDNVTNLRLAVRKAGPVAGGGVAGEAFDVPPFPAGPSAVDALYSWCESTACGPGLSHAWDAHHGGGAGGSLRERYRRSWARQVLPAAEAMASAYTGLQSELFSAAAGASGTWRHIPQGRVFGGPPPSPSPSPAQHPSRPLVSLEGRWSPPLSKAEMAKRLGMSRKRFDIFIKAFPIQRFSRQLLMVRIDHMDVDNQKKLEG